MAIKKVFAGATIRRPGAYSETTTQQTQGAPLGDNGTLLIVGEAETGAPGDVEGLQVFKATQFAALVAEFTSGPIVDAAKAAFQSPSRVLGIGNADEVYVWKTNSSTKASLVLSTAAPSTLITIKDRNFGFPGNQTSIQVAAGTAPTTQKIVSIRRGSSVQTLNQNPAEVQLNIQYTGSGTPAALVIGGTLTAKTLTTTVTGDAPSNLALNLNAFASMKDLCEYIDAQPNYTCTLGTPLKAAITKPSSLDPVTIADVKAAPGALLRTQQELIDIINDNALLVEASITTLAAGLPAVSGPTLMSGGAKGASTTADFSQGFDKSLASDVNVILPAVSRSAAADISDNLTDAASTYDISAIAAALSTHLNLRSNTKNRREAQGMMGYRVAAKATLYTFCQTIGNGLIQVFGEDCLITDVNSNLTWKQPHILAALCAGIRLGSNVGTPLTHKYPNCNGTGHAVDPVTGIAAGDFNADVDYEEAIDAGLTFTEKSAGGVRICVDNTTYGADQNFYLNRGSTIEAAQYAAKTLRETAEDVFVGNVPDAGIAKSIQTILGNKLNELWAAKVIISSDDGAPKGWKNLTVEVVGSTAYVSVNICPAVGMEFIFISFSLSEIVQSA